jgi:hypothetical protein
VSFPQIERLLQLDELIRSNQRHTQASLAQADLTYTIIRSFVTLTGLPSTPTIPSIKTRQITDCC